MARAKEVKADIEAKRKRNIVKTMANAKAKKENDHTAALVKDIKKYGRKNKEIRDADLRLRLAGEKTVDRINFIIDEFTVLDQQIKNAKNTKKNPSRLRERITKNTARGQILKTQSDMLFKKLNKLLPDIKSIEHSGIFKPSKPENMPEEQLIDILKGNVDINEMIKIFPQYAEMMKDLEDLEIPQLPN